MAPTLCRICRMRNGLLLWTYQDITGVSLTAGLLSTATQVCVGLITHVSRRPSATQQWAPPFQPIHDQLGKDTFFFRDVMGSWDNSVRLSRP